MQLTAKHKENIGKFIVLTFLCLLVLTVCVIAQKLSDKTQIKRQGQKTGVMLKAKNEVKRRKSK